MFQRRQSSGDILYIVYNRMYETIHVKQYQIKAYRWSYYC